MSQPASLQSVTKPSLRAAALPERFFATSRNDLIQDFYVPCLSSSIQYDRAVGFFRSSVLALVGIPFTRFAQDGGRARFLCSPEFDAADVDAMRSGYGIDELSAVAVDRELDRVLEHPEGARAVELLSTLISVGCLDIRIVIKEDAVGIFHHKIGLFRDSKGDEISFLGSTNESWSGWSPSGNDESFEVFESWTDSEARVQAHREFFENSWSGSEPGLRVLRFTEAFERRLLRFAAPEGIESVPRFVLPTRRDRPSLFEHQEAAVADWIQNGYRGLLRHATGSGKTVTALACIDQWFKKGGIALVVVPSEALLHQWGKEITAFFGPSDPPVLFAGGGHSRSQWLKNLPAFTSWDGDSRLVVATVQTATTEEFLRRISDESHLLIVADEVHRVGSEGNRSLLTVNASGRLGLSATPERFGDPEGTRVILEFFSPTLQPIFDLSDAIEAGRLCPYTYYVHEVRLDDDEMEEWQRLSIEIGQASAIGEGGPPSEHLLWLLIRRAALLKQARGKPSAAETIVTANYEDGQSWIVYCDDQKQLGEVMSLIERRDLPVFEYHSAMEGDRSATLGYFRQQGGIVVAIRCLDEGVDIPSVTHALILASSRNTREFVQRRGRVLRTHPNKTLAEIHDVMCFPPEGTEMSVEARFASGELGRAFTFARDATNRGTRARLLTRAIELGLDPTVIEGREFEDDS